MASRIDAKGVAWAVFFVVIIVALYDILSAHSFIANLFSGAGGSSETRLQRMMRRAVER